MKPQSIREHGDGGAEERTSEHIGGEVLIVLQKAGRE